MKTTEGYSIIELIVVLALILLASTVALVNYTRSVAESSLDKAAKQMNDVLYLAKNSANNADVKVCNYTQGAAAFQNIFFYRVRWDNTLAAYTLDLSCDNAATWRRIEQYTLPSNFTRFGDQEVVFQSFNRGLQPAANRSFTIVNNSLRTNNCVPFTINSLGVIEMGPKNTCPVAAANSSICILAGPICMTLNNCSLGNSPQWDCENFNANASCTTPPRGVWSTCN